MKVIKVVYEREEKLVSTFAGGKWRKEYGVGVETKPDTGYLFAYSTKNMKGAKANFDGSYAQFWLAEAEVVGRVSEYFIDVIEDAWQEFWIGYKLQARLPRADYLLCSSITLIKRLPNNESTI